MTEAVFRQDAYATSCDAVVTAVTDAGIALDRTVFYPNGGGQPGDTGLLLMADGTAIDIIDTRKGEAPDAIVHVPSDPKDLKAGDKVRAEIDWPRRYAHMRLHSCLHLLSAVLPFPVTGGQVAADKGRLDFDMPESPDKDAVTAQLNAMIAADHPVGARWIADDELAAQPDLVKTMSVKPPTGAGRVRLIEIDGLDLQPCGGTHVARTGEIGPVLVAKIEKKGKMNRRVVVRFADDGA